MSLALINTNFCKIHSSYKFFKDYNINLNKFCLNSYNNNGDYYNNYYYKTIKSKSNKINLILYQLNLKLFV